MVRSTRTICSLRLRRMQAEAFGLVAVEQRGNIDVSHPN